MPVVRVGNKDYHVRFLHPNKIAVQDRRCVKPAGRYRFSRKGQGQESEAWKNVFGNRTRLQVAYVLLRLSRMKRRQHNFFESFEYRNLNQRRMSLGKGRLVRHMCLPKRRGGKKTPRNFLLLTEGHRKALKEILQGATLEEFARHLLSLETAVAVSVS